MNISCDIIKDILPLYAEELVSADSRALVQDHLARCENCRKAHEAMKKAPPMPQEREPGSLRRVEQQLRRRRWHAAMLAMLATATLLFAAFVYLTTPMYLTAWEAIADVTTTDAGTIDISFRDEVHDYEVERLNSTEGGAHVVILAWRYRLCDILDWESQPRPCSLECNLDRVWYSSVDPSEEDTLLWGRPLNGGVITLPRLALGFYFLMALGSGIVLTILSLLWRKRAEWLSAGAALCWCFVLSSLFVTQGKFPTYRLLPVLAGIGILTLLLFGTIWLGYGFWRQHRQDRADS